MSVVKIIEILCEGNSIEDALNEGLKEAAKTVHNIKQIDVKWIHAHVEKDKITKYRVSAKVSFVVEHHQK
ncbi:MAG TPA: dodecin family protein [Chlamydiales bacterium]|nr:MAG: hypothetical protein A3F67_12010 [Verrucomicrobia bacterium RIFCSPHIGHO2_12_FULL_41_10]HLB52585.1 dodecin family protein [Chlamydiales bacterium]